MRTLLPDPPPVPFDQLLAQRSGFGADRRDEVWEGVLHVNPPASHEHERLVMLLGRLLGPYADAAGLELTGAVAIGHSGDYRAPDLALHRPDAAEQWHPTAALVVEVTSPNDETWGKVPFYAAHRVDELLIVDTHEQQVQWRAIEGGEYRPIEKSRLIDLGPSEVSKRTGWQ